MTVILLLIVVSWGLITSPLTMGDTAFSRAIRSYKDPVPVDAIPNIGENQQIVFTAWPGRSPQDIEDQISYPLTTYLLGIPGVKSIRSSSIFGFSSIYLIFNEDIEFYWSRSRILEKLNSLPAGLLPEDAKPALGPDATALGQVYWYTIEGRDPQGNPTGGWDLHEIRSVQDFYVKYSLNAAEGVSEVASIGGFVQEYQIDIDPDKLRHYGISLPQVVKAVQASNRDVGAKTLEVNQAEYLVRGLGYIKSLKDLELTVVSARNHTPIYLKQVAAIGLGAAIRRGVLDKGGAEVVGGVVVARYGENPLRTIQNVKAQIREIQAGLPKKVLPDGTESQLTIVPFYDRSELIHETLGTLEEALALEILISVLVVIVMVRHFRASLLIASLLPISVLLVFVGMRYTDVEANIVALSGIAIAIGTVVDLGIILTENILKHLEEAPPEQSLTRTVYEGAAEVSYAIVTAVSTTIISFTPVFLLEGAEGKLFGPLAFTKTYALLAALAISLLILPTLATFLLWRKKPRNSSHSGAVLEGGNEGVAPSRGGSPSRVPHVEDAPDLPTPTRWGNAQFLPLNGRQRPLASFFSKLKQQAWLLNAVAVLPIIGLLGSYWLPLGPSRSWLANSLFVALLLGLILGFFLLIEHYYSQLLRVCLKYPKSFLALPSGLLVMGLAVWLGFSPLFQWLSWTANQVGWAIEETRGWKRMSESFPGIGKEFMPALDEGAFLLMPTSMPHSGIAYNRKVLGQLDMAVNSIPEVSMVVGKLGRVSSSLDPAPISMYENIINYKPEYALDASGYRRRFKVDEEGRYITKDGEALSGNEMLAEGLGAQELVADENGQYFRNWRAQIQSPDDIWTEIVEMTKLPGVTSAPKLQPIETRLVMLQTGMRAPMGIKVYGPDLQTIEQFGQRLETILKAVPSVKSEAVFADRIVGKPYLHLKLNREKMARYGLSVDQVQSVIEMGIGGKTITSTVEGRERFPVRVRYMRELRDSPEALGKVLVATNTGAQIPLEQVVDIDYEQGPQAIKSEDTFLVGYVLFDKRDGYAAVSVVEAAQKAIQEQVDSGSLEIPASIRYRFSGSYENQVRAEKRLSIIVPVVLLIVFLILYFQFKSVSTTLMVFMGIALAFSGGFILLWLYDYSGFMDFELFGANIRDLFQIETVNLSVAVWVGFIALFGIATDDGVLMATYLDQSFSRNKTADKVAMKEAVIEAGRRRIRPAIMTSATTLIALLPILTSTGRGSDIMIPMAIPAFGGMLMAAITYFLVPTLYYLREVRKR